MVFENTIYMLGELAVFIGGWIQSIPILLIAGFLAGEGELPLVLTLILASLGSFLGGTANFLFGRYFGKKIINKYEYIKKRSDAINKKIRKYDALSIILFKFIQGVKIASGIFFGTTKISFAKYSILNLIGSLLWGVSIVLLGYFFGFLAQEMFGAFENIQNYFLILLVVLLISYVVVKKVKRKK